MAPRNNRVGQIHGNFLVESFYSTDKNSTYWNCKCLNCGQFTIRHNRYFRKDRPVPTFCIKCPKEFHANFKGYKSLSKVYLSRIKQQAKLRNLNFNVTPEFLVNLFLKQDEKCFYTNLPINFSKNQTASLDRLDSSKGYTEDNVVWCHKDVNKMKNNLSLKRFFELCRLVNEPKVPEVK